MSLAVYPRCPLRNNTRSLSSHSKTNVTSWDPELSSLIGTRLWVGSVQNRSCNKKNKKNLNGLKIYFPMPSRFPYYRSRVDIFTKFLPDTFDYPTWSSVCLRTEHTIGSQKMGYSDRHSDRQGHSDRKMGDSNNFSEWHILWEFSFQCLVKAHPSAF